MIVSFIGREVECLTICINRKIWIDTDEEWLHDTLRI